MAATVRSVGERQSQPTTSSRGTTPVEEFAPAGELQTLADGSLQALGHGRVQALADDSSQVSSLSQVQALADDSSQVRSLGRVQALATGSARNPGARAPLRPTPQAQHRFGPVGGGVSLLGQLDQMVASRVTHAFPVSSRHVTLHAGFAGMGTAQGSLGDTGLLGASRGDRIALAPPLFHQLQTSRPSALAEKTLYHELAHTRQPTPRASTQGKGEDPTIVHDERNEQDADAVAELAFRGGQIERPSDRFTGGPNCVQASMQTARREAESRRRFADASKAYELNMGKTLRTDVQANAAVDLMLHEFQTITREWAIATVQQHRLVRKQSFAWKGGDKYFGAFRMTARNIGDVFAHAGSKPLRQKLKIIYNSVRNNNFSKWLKVAAQQLDMEMRAPTLSRTLQVENVDKSTSETVGATFANNSGLRAKLLANPLRRAEVLNAVWNDDPIDATTNMPVHKTGMKKFSSAMNISQHTRHHDIDRIGGMNRERDVLRMSPLKMRDLELTDEEIHQIGINQNLIRSSVTDESRIRTFVRSFRAAQSKGNRPIPWEKGTGYYDVLIDSVTENLARPVRARLVAGISGSTDLMLHAATYLNFSLLNMKKLRLALLGWMLEAQDHSFFEIMEASRAYGLPFNLGASVGEMYEINANFHPKHAVDFQMNFSSMFADAPSEDSFPSALVDATYVGDIKLESPRVKLSTYRGRYVGLGISSEILRYFSADDMANVEQIDIAVTKAPLKVGHGKIDPHNFQVRRKLRDTAAFVDLSLARPIHSELVLTQLIKKRHGSKALGAYEKQLYGAKEHLPAANADLTQRRTILRGAGIPAQLVDRLQGVDVNQALELRALIQNSRFRVGAKVVNSKKLRTIKGSRPFTILNGRLGVWMNALLGALLAEVDPRLRTKGLSLEHTNPQQASVVALGVPEAIAVMLDPGNIGLVRGLAEAIGVIAQNADTKRQKIRAIENLTSHTDYTNLVTAIGVHNVKIIAYGIAQKRGFDLGSFTSKRGKRAALEPWAYATLGEVLGSSSVRLNQTGRGAVKDQILARNFPGPISATGTREMDTTKARMSDNLNDMAIGGQYTDTHKQKFRRLEPVEVYAINQYTQHYGMGVWQGMLGNRDASQQWTGLGEKTIQEQAWVMKAAVAGMNRLPVHSGTVYNGQPLPCTKGAGGQYNLVEVDNFANGSYPMGRIIRQDTFFSSAKHVAASFIAKDTHNLAWVIEFVRTGRDIQPISDKPGEEEVLFPPGAKFMVNWVDNSKINLPDTSGDALKGKLVVHLVEV